MADQNGANLTTTLDTSNPSRGAFRQDGREPEAKPEIACRRQPARRDTAKATRAAGSGASEVRRCWAFRATRKSGNPRRGLIRPWLRSTAAPPIPYHLLDSLALDGDPKSQVRVKLVPFIAAPNLQAKATTSSFSLATKSATPSLQMKWMPPWAVAAFRTRDSTDIPQSHPPIALISMRDRERVAPLERSSE
jgi:hypothetical protein